MSPSRHLRADFARPVSAILRRAARRSLVATLLTLAAVSCASSPPDIFSGVERIIAIGDVHGGYDEFVAILQSAGVVDSRNRWSGGKTHLVQTGDLLDRGDGSRRVMDLVMRLETEALAAGGRVHALLGNHEVMNLTGDLRYTSPGEYAAFATAESTALRDWAYPMFADPVRQHDPAYRQQWDKEHPLGWVEHRQAYGPTGRYGKWIRRHNAVVKINDYLFLHGGIGPLIASKSVREVNDRVREEIRLKNVPKDSLAVGRGGPLWYRGLAQNAEADLQQQVDRILAHYGVSHIVIGHTTTPGTIVPRLNGAVLLIDVGLSRHYGAHPACLVVERGVPFTLHRGRLLRVPMDGTDGLLAYLRAAAALDPAPSSLDPLIETGGRLPLENDAPDRR